MSKLARLAFSIFLAAVLSACGAKGPLFLPEKPAPVEDVPADAPAEATPTDTAPASGGTEPAELPAEPPVTPPPADGNG